MTSFPAQHRGLGALTTLTRLALAVVVIVAAGVVAVVVTAPASQAQATLRDAAAAQGRVFGAAVAQSHLGEADYLNTLNTEFNGATPENEMKWDTTEPSQGSFNFSAADQIVANAEANGQAVRGHTLVWHSQLPGWVSGLSGDAVSSAMENHIAEVAGHFQGQLVAWDVVNEAFEENGTRRQSVFQTQLGDGYIAQAFEAARAADPGAQLCYNDFNTDGINAKSDAVFDLVSDLAGQGLIDCVGFQGHMIVGQVPSDYQANLQRFADLGVDVHITELDIRMPTPPSEANLQQQAGDYDAVVSACLAVSSCTSITTWGITDMYSWIPGVFPNEGAALLFDDSYAKKPAYDSTLTALGGGTP